MFCYKYLKVDISLASGNLHQQIRTLKTKKIFNKMK